VSQPTRMPPGGHDYTPEMLAIAIVEAELRVDMRDRDLLIATAVAEDPHRVIDVLANLLMCELVGSFEDGAAGRLDNLRWALLSFGGGA
jgi:hypothetical protein